MLEGSMSKIKSEGAKLSLGFGFLRLRLGEEMNGEKIGEIDKSEYGKCHGGHFICVSWRTLHLVSGPSLKQGHV